MNPEHQILAIAKLCPFVFVTPEHDLKWCPRKGSPSIPFLPISDLNACHEMEKVLGFHDALFSDKARRYAWILWRITSEDDVWEDDTEMTYDFSTTDLIYILSATAAQRAEAVLRTLNLWTE